MTQTSDSHLCDAAKGLPAWQPGDVGFGLTDVALCAESFEVERFYWANNFLRDKLNMHGYVIY